MQCGVIYFVIFVIGCDNIVNHIVLSFKCLAPPCPPKSLQVSKETTSTISLEWLPPESDGGAPINCYLLDMKGPHDSNFSHLCQVDGDILKYTVTKLESGSQYDFQVKAENEAGTSKVGAQLKTPALTRTKSSEIFNWFFPQRHFMKYICAHLSVIAATFFHIIGQSLDFISFIKSVICNITFVRYYVNVTWPLIGFVHSEEC